MVFTHIPSSAAVLIFPLPPVFWLTVCGPSVTMHHMLTLFQAILLFVRAGLNNMDQAPRSALIAGIVKPEERTAVMGITSMVRTLAATTGPMVTGFLAGSDRFWVAFVAAGACRLTYDIGLWILFGTYTTSASWLLLRSRVCVVNVRLHEHEQPEMRQTSNQQTQTNIDDEEGVASLPSSDDSSDSGRQ